MREKDIKSKSRNMKDRIYFWEVGMGTKLVVLSKTRGEKREKNMARKIKDSERVREKESKSKSKNMKNRTYFREVGMGTVLVHLLRDRKVSTGLLLVHS